MASRKLIFQQSEEEKLEHDIGNYGSKPPPWGGVVENLNLRHKQSAWGEEDISDLPTPRSRERFAYDNAGYVASESTKDDGGSIIKQKKKKRTVKKKGRISESCSDVVAKSEPDYLVSREIGSETVFSSRKSRSQEDRQIHREELQRRPERFETTTVNVMETIKKGYEESEDESASMTVRTMMSTPTTQRQSVSWTPSPIPRKGSSKLPPLPAFPEESTQKSALWLNTMERGGQSNTVVLAVQRGPVKKKKRKKKLSVNIEAPQLQDGNDTMGDAFELSLLKPGITGRKKRKGLSEQRESFEESSQDPTPSERHPVERLQDYFMKRESLAVVKPEVSEETFILERPTTSSKRNKKESPDNSSGSDGAGGGTYSISPKKSTLGMAAGEGTGDEESDAILDGDSSGGQNEKEDDVEEDITSGRAGIQKRPVSGKSGVEKGSASGKSGTEKRLSDGEEGVSEGKSSSRRGSDSKLLTMEQLGLGTPTDPQPMGWEISSSQDVIWSFKEAILWEKDAYFYPSSCRVPVEERMPPGFDEHSFLGEDELLTSKPYMSITNHARLENRILSEANRNWFGEDGELLALPNPIRSVALRPPHIPLSSSTWDLPPGLQIEYRPALVGVFGKGYEDDLYEVISQDIELGRGTLTRSKRRRGCLLEVELLSMEFAHHPLFSKEHVLAHRLTSLWAEWESRRSVGKAKVLAEKVERLRDEKKRLTSEITNVQQEQASAGDATVDNDEEKDNLTFGGPHSSKTTKVMPTKLHSLKQQLHYKLEELKRARIERDLEGKADRKTLESLLFAWRDLKLLRQEQGFSSTPLCLYIQAESIQKRIKKVGSPFGYASDVSAGEDGRSTYRVDEPKIDNLGRKAKKDGKSKKVVDGAAAVPPIKPRRKFIKKKMKDALEPENNGNVNKMWIENETQDKVAVKDEVGSEEMDNKRETGHAEGLEAEPSTQEKSSKAVRHGETNEDGEVEAGSQVTMYSVHLGVDGEQDGTQSELTHSPSGIHDTGSKSDYADGMRKRRKKKKRLMKVKEGIELDDIPDAVKHETEEENRDEITDESGMANRITAKSPGGDSIFTSGPTEYHKDENQNEERLNQLKMSSRQRRRERLKSFYLAELSAAMELSGLAHAKGEPSDIGGGVVLDGEHRPVPAPRASKGQGDSVREKSENGITTASNEGENGEPGDTGQTVGETEINEEEMLAAEWREWQNELEREVEERLEEAQAEWELEMEQYRLVLQEWEFKKEMFRRNRQKRKQKQLKDKSKERKKRKKGKKEPLTGSISEDEEEEEMDEEEVDSDTGTNDDEWVAEKPFPPERVDPRVIHLEVEETMKSSRRPPGEPRLILKLFKDIKDDTKVACPREKERRFAVELTEIQARIFYNGQEACRSKPIPLTQTFSPIVDHAFSIRGLGPPSSLAIELFERLRGHSAAGSGIGGWYPLALIHLPVPSRKTVMKEDTLPERLEFGNDKVVAYPHAGVGSGIYFSPFPNVPDSMEEERINLCLHLSGGIWCRSGWAVNEDGVVLSPKGYNYLGQSEEEKRNEEEINSIRKLLIMLQRGAGATGWNSSKYGGMERLRQLAEDARAKASTHANDELFQLIEDWSLSRLDSKEHFRLDPLMEEFKFDSSPWRKRETRDNQKKDNDDWWTANRRLRILHLRDKGVPEFRSLHCIPLNDREIPQDIFKGYEDRIQSQLTHSFSIREDLNPSTADNFTLRIQKGGGDKFPSESGGCDPHEGRREWGRKFLQEARFRLLQQSHLVRKQQKRLSDLVIEEQVPTMGSLGMTLLERLKPKRPLKPMRRSGLGGSSMTSGATGGPGGPNPPGSLSREVQVKVNVVRAFGVPVRRDIDPVMDSGPWNSPSSSSRPWYWEPQQSQILSEHGLAEVLVRPFVEVALGTARARTTTALGVNPTWNEELQLTLNLETSVLEKTKKQNTSLHMSAFDHSGDDEFDSSAWWTSNGDVNSIEDLYLSILLKDEAVVDLLVDNRAREAGEIHQTTQKHFLASLRIPVSTLRFNQRMEGTFRMSSPPVLLGYTREEIAFGSGQYSGSVRLLPITSPVPGLQPGVIYLTLFITVQPPLPALHMDFEDEHVLESIELPHVESHLRAWEMEVFRAVSRGCCPPKALVPDLVGKTVCATRFLRPIVPPPGLPLTSKRGSGAVTADWLARFVSMIPLSTGHQLIDIWLNSEQMLRLLCGSRVDHAILLTCLFMHLGLEVWLAQGSGLPDGPNCSFVLTKGIGKGYTERKCFETRGKSPDHGRVASGSRKSWKEEQTSGDDESEDFESEYDADWWVWDPIRGQRFEVRDPFCPLQHLWWLTNDQNIWANIQRDDQPQHMNFNLEIRRDWWPAFTQAPASGGLFTGLLSYLPRWFSRFDSGSDMQIQAPSSVVGSVQPESLPYESRAGALMRLNRRKGGKRKGKDDLLETNPDLYLKSLEERLENHLQSCVMHWRKNNLTVWNRHGSSLLRKLLPRLEHPIVGSGDHSLDENHLWELKSLMSSHKVCGFPINVPYDGMASAREALRTTGVHSINEPGVEFALAVYLHPYCGIKGESSSVLSLWVYVASLVSRKSQLD